jgi:hypothetical protein
MIERWICTNVEIDLVENEITIDPLLKSISYCFRLAYINDFGGSNATLVAEALKHITQRIDKQAILNDIREQRLYVSFRGRSS